MAGLSTTGARLRVKPQTEIQAAYENSRNTFSDATPFDFMVESYLVDVDLDLFFGLFGPIIQGPDRYSGLYCNLMARIIPLCDWETLTSTHVNFKVGRSRVIRDESLSLIEIPEDCEYYHLADGTKLKGFPRYTSFGTVELVPNTG